MAVGTAYRAKFKGSDPLIFVPLGFFPRECRSRVFHEVRLSPSQLFLLPVVNWDGLRVEAKSSHESSTSWSFSDGLRSKIEEGVGIIHGPPTIKVNHGESSCRQKTGVSRADPHMIFRMKTSSLLSGVSWPAGWNAWLGAISSK
jgi:hypothetical protein